MCLCFGCSGVGECVGGLDQGLQGWGGVMYVDCAWRMDTCASEVHPLFNPVAPYGYLLPNM